jgi:hypothetical protein
MSLILSRSVCSLTIGTWSNSGRTDSSRRRNVTYCLRSTNTFILFGIRRKCLISGWSLLLCQFTKRVIKGTVIIIVWYHCFQYHTTKIVSNILLARLRPYVDELIGDHQCGFRRKINDWSDFLHLSDTGEKMGVK